MLIIRAIMKQFHIRCIVYPRRPCFSGNNAIMKDEFHFKRYFTELVTIVYLGVVIGCIIWPFILSKDSFRGFF